MIGFIVLRTQCSSKFHCITYIMFLQKYLPFLPIYPHNWKICTKHRYHKYCNGMMTDASEKKFVADDDEDDDDNAADNDEQRTDCCEITL